MVAGSTFFLLTALALGLGTSSAQDDGGLFHADLGPVAQGRIDPIVNPGRFAAHAHTIFGASNFRNVLNTPAEQHNAGCTSASFSVDKSNYWIPTLYFINSAGKYEPVQAHGGRAYYLIRGDKNVAYPDGFRVVAGTANNRAADDVRKAGVGYHCSEHANGPAKVNLYLPNGMFTSVGCEDMVTRVTFPSCGWANQSLDSWDHSSHMTYPLNGPQGDGLMYYDPFSGKDCPASHPVKYPTLNLEVYWRLTKSQLSQWRSGPDAINFIWANGDTHGTTLHADFVFGWPQDLFQKMAKGCSDANCAANEFKDITLTQNCRFQGMLPDEDLGYINPLDQLPGCNPRWDLSQGDTKPSECPWFTHEPGWTPPNAVIKVAGGQNPVALDLPGVNLTRDSLMQYTKDKDVYTFQPVTDVRHEFNNNPWINRWWNGTQADIDANKVQDTAVNKQPKVIDMGDSAAFDAILPTTAPVGQEQWATTKEVGTFTKWEYQMTPPAGGAKAAAAPMTTSSAGLPSGNVLAANPSGSASATADAAVTMATPSVVDAAASPSATSASTTSGSGTAVAHPTGGVAGTPSVEPVAASANPSAVGTPLGSDPSSSSSSSSGAAAPSAVGTPIGSGSHVPVASPPSDVGPTATPSDSGTPVGSGKPAVPTTASTTSPTAAAKPGRCRPKHRRRHYRL
ncbi:uncharacterized protein LOC62_03G003938 [Vanrija pseudolonga]|uniref:DUF1996 domain-containing protein n=1 Tax=Vanrija pseudolonga TaxID=143232 RepID=A0AAF0Y5A7_9TREE|nr:hypothetical protein LOC62_03G003938 [Vanrija pseudolonga]